MDIISIILGLLPMVASYGAVGKILATIIAVAGGLSGVVTALVAMWHALVLVLQALSILPGLSSLASLAQALAADEAKITSFSQGTLLPLLNRLSAVQLPTSKS